MRRNAILIFAVLGAGAVGGSGCAFGNEYGFATVVASVQASGSATVAVATQDRRAAITAGEKTPDFVGIQRGGYGNPFDVTTVGQRPLADAMTEAICASLRKQGFAATPIPAAPHLTAEQIRAQVLAAKPQIGLMVYIVEWRSDTYTNVGLKYALELYAIDASGNAIAASKVDGDENLGGSAWNPPAHARKAVPEAFQAALERLLNHDEVRAALSMQ